NEAFNVQLANPVNATLGSPSVGIGIVNNDDGVPSLFVNDVSLPEGNSGSTAFVFTVLLSNPSDQTVKVDYSTANGSATLANNDYQQANGTLTIPPKTGSGTFTVLVNG